MTRTARRLAIVALLATLLGLTAPQFSSAAFTATSSRTIKVSAAADWTPPTVSLPSPGSPVKDTVTLTATASDAETGIANVEIQYLPSGGSSWVTVCTTPGAPYSCSWNTKLGNDGAYSLRARATDNAGYTTTTDPVSTYVANSFGVSLADPGGYVRGTVSLATTLYNAGTVSYTVRVEYSTDAGATWKNICNNLASPYTCSWSSTGYANGDHLVRSAATSGGTTTYSTAVDVVVDNLAPTVTMNDPGTPIRGTVDFTATAADAHSGIAQVVLQYAVTGTTTYTNLCTVTTSPYTCRTNTTTIPDGTYTFRAIATDAAGNTATSALVTNRLIDNTVSSVTMDDPGAFLSGTVNLTASANSTAGVTSVTIQRAPSGTATWTVVCTDTTAPYSCPFITTAVADGLYDFRAVLVDGASKTTTSATVSARRVDNSPLRAVDVQAVNGGGTVGKLEANDTLTLAYSQQVTLTSITSGWTGSALAVSVRLRDGQLVGGSSKADQLDVLKSGVAVNLGSVNLADDYIKGGKTVVFNATMTATTRVVGGITQTVVTLQLGTIASGTGLRAVTTSPTMVWTPSTLALALNNGACSAAPVTETGTADRDW